MVKKGAEMFTKFKTAVRAGLAAAVIVSLAGAALAQTVELTILHVNDVYKISPSRGKGGLAELMTLLRVERARAENHLTTLGGDLISPSVMSGLTKGAQMIELMNAVGLDVAGFGNHEFDFGPEVLRQRMAESKFHLAGDQYPRQDRHALRRPQGDHDPARSESSP